MTLQLASVLALLAAAITMFVMNRPRMDVAALIMLVALPFTGAVSMGEALSGFADPNIVLIGALFVLGEGLVRTGVARNLGDWLIRKTGNSETLLVTLLMVVVCAIGSTMSSTAVTAIFIPVVLRIAHTTGASPGRLMMPLSFAALISGMTTLVATTPNLVVNSELVRQGAEGFHFFSFTPFGVPILVLGILYMLVARRWLPDNRSGSADAATRPTLAGWVQQYGLARREFRVRVGESSSLVGRSLADIDIRHTSGANILAIDRAGTPGGSLERPSSSTILEPGDVLLVDLFAPRPDIDAVCAHYKLEQLPLAGNYFADRAQELGMAELLVPADSPLVGRTAVESGFRSQTGLTVIGLRRGPSPHEGCIREQTIEAGDTLLVVGSWADIRRVEPDDVGAVILRVPIELGDVLPVRGKAWKAFACLAVVVVLMVWGVVPAVQAALLGCLLMGALGCIDLTSAYRAIDWKTILLIVGMLPFSLALQRTGGVDKAADALMALTGGVDLRIVLAALFAVTSALGMFISNTATAVLMAPVALAVAKELGASPYPFAMIVALAASTAFVTPVSSPVNTLVVTPGGYRFSDFVRVGGPFAVIVLIVSVLLVPVLLPFFPA